MLLLYEYSPKEKGGVSFLATGFVCVDAFTICLAHDEQLCNVTTETRQKHRRYGHMGQRGTLQYKVPAS